MKSCVEIRPSETLHIFSIDRLPVLMIFPNRHTIAHTSGRRAIQLKNGYTKCNQAQSDESTTANISGQIDPIPTKTTAEAVLEIRRRSGLTWNELSEIFDVSRRSVHRWANGKRISARNERLVYRTLEAIDHLDEGNPFRTRARLLNVGILGLSPFIMLASHEFEQVTDLIQGAAKLARHSLPLSPESLEARRPAVPISLLSANPGRFKSSASKARLVRLATKTK